MVGVAGQYPCWHQTMSVGQIPARLLCMRSMFSCLMMRCQQSTAGDSDGCAFLTTVSHFCSAAPVTPSQAVNTRAIKNKVKIASSTKRPRYPVYEEGGRIVWIKPGQEELVFGAVEATEQQQQQPAELKITVTEA